MQNADNRKKLIIIVAWFFIPLAIAVSWYKLLPEEYRPSSMTNNGELLDPVFTLAPFTHQTLKGDTFGNRDIEKVWTLVHFIEGECDERCSKSLYGTRQMRISFGKDIDRVNRVAILYTQVQSESNQKMWASHPDLQVLMATENGIGEQIEKNVEDFNRAENAVFLLDPLGNVVMRFPASLDVKLMKKDIRKLLKLSHIG